MHFYVNQCYIVAKVARVSVSIVEYYVISPRILRRLVEKCSLEKLLSLQANFECMYITAFYTIFPLYYTVLVGKWSQ